MHELVAIITHIVHVNCFAWCYVILVAVNNASAPARSGRKVTFQLNPFQQPLSFCFVAFPIKGFKWRVGQPPDKVPHKVLYIYIDIDIYLSNNPPVHQSCEL